MLGMSHPVPGRQQHRNWDTTGWARRAGSVAAQAQASASGSLMGRQSAGGRSAFHVGADVPDPAGLARVLKLEDYGTYKQLILISTTLYQVLPFGMAQSLYFFVPRVEARRPFSFRPWSSCSRGRLGRWLILTFADPIALRFSNPGIAEHKLLWRSTPAS